MNEGQGPVCVDGQTLARWYAVYRPDADGHSVATTQRSSGGREAGMAPKPQAAALRVATRFDGAAYTGSTSNREVSHAIQRFPTAS